MLLEHCVDGRQSIEILSFVYSHLPRNATMVKYSHVTRTFDNWIFRKKLLVISVTDARLLQRRDKTLPTNIKRSLAHVITKWIVARHVSFKITTVINCSNPKAVVRSPRLPQHHAQKLHYHKMTSCDNRNTDETYWQMLQRKRLPVPLWE